MLLALTTAEKLQAVPREVWLNIAIGVGIFIAGFLVLRAVAQMNKILMGVLVFVVLATIGANWVYYRNEPKCLTPLFDKFAPFLPSGASSAHKAKKQDIPF